MSLLAKYFGLRVIASDIARRAQLVGLAILANSGGRLSRADVWSLFDKPQGPYRRIAQERHHPGTFSLPQAQFLDTALAVARAAQEVKGDLLEYLMMKWVLRAVPISSPGAQDAGKAVRQDWDALTPRRLHFYHNAQGLLHPDKLWGLAQEVNQGIFPGELQVHRTDARQLIPQIPADVIYFDPPYVGTTGYLHHYSVLDELLGDDSSSQAPVPSLEELLPLACHIPIWLVSYGGTSLGLDELEDMCRRHGYRVGRSLPVPHPHLGPVASRERNQQNREYTLLATRSQK